MKPPNIILIVTDNQSAWTLGCYGNPEIRTPHIDTLAAQGMRMDRAFCVNPVCSPNRATLLTGLMPSQHGVHSWLGREQPSAQMGDGAYNTIAEFCNLPQILHERGYVCGLTGKWHLGDSLHPPQAFSTWFTLTQGHTRSFYDTPCIRDGREVIEPDYFLDVIGDHATRFLREQSDQAPFFLYLPCNGPYGLDHDLRDVHRNRHSDTYADQPMTSFPRNPPHPWLRQNHDVINNVQAMRNYAAAVSGVDDLVGRVLATLAEQGHDENTLVIFTADHGLCAGHHGMWGMGDHSRPLHMYAPNMHVPLIVRHRARIEGGRACDRAVSHYDLLPTLMHYLDIPQAREDGHLRPGESYASALRGDDTPSTGDDRLIYYEYENTRGVENRQWKWIRRHPAGPDELFNLREDPGEWVNLCDDPAFADAQMTMNAHLDTFFHRYARKEHDRWRGGVSKAGTMEGM